MDMTERLVAELAALKARVANLERLEKSSFVAHAPVTLDMNSVQVNSLTGQELGLQVQVHNFAWIGPTAGAPAIPTFRLLTAADMPGAVFVPLATLLGSTYFDGDAFAADGDGTIDLVAVFGLPVGVKAISLCLGAKDETVGVTVGVGYDIDNVGAVLVTTQAANVYVYNSGIVPAKNDTVYFYLDGEVDGVFIQISGYWI